MIITRPSENSPKPPAGTELGWWSARSKSPNILEDPYSWLLFFLARTKLISPELFVLWESVDVFGSFDLFLRYLFLLSGSLWASFCLCLGPPASISVISDCISSFTSALEMSFWLEYKEELSQLLLSFLFARLWLPPVFMPSCWLLYISSSLITEWFLWGSWVLLSGELLFGIWALACSGVFWLWSWTLAEPSDA